MNKKLEEYKKKSNRIIMTLKILGVSIFVLGILISIVQYTINKAKEDNQKIANVEMNYSIDLANNAIIYEKNFEINLIINNFDNNNVYRVEIKIDGKENINEITYASSNKFNINLDSEGKKEVNVIIYLNDIEQFNTSRTIYYIEPYKTQFLEKTENNGVVMHIRDGTKENYLTDIDLFKKAGGTYVREDFLFLDKFLKNEDQDYAVYDKWINKINDEGLKLLLTFNGTDKSFAGNDCKINSDEEIDKFVQIAKNIVNRYPFIEEFELINEPNLNKDTGYKSEEDLFYYSKLLTNLTEELKKINPNITISTGGTVTLYDLTKNTISSEDFIRLISKYTRNTQMVYAYHPYDNTNQDRQNGSFYNLLNSHFNLLSDLGGFSKSYITEYGVSSSESYNITEELQAEKVVQQTTILDNYGVELAIEYNMWNTTTDTYHSIRNYGLLHNDYTPKLAYYSMKYYYQNTNGSEYIGKLNIEDGLESHVYNKDGKPLIIAWSNNKNNTYDFSLNNMIAKDIYGKKITPDEEGKIQITTSPVYLYNVPNNNFHQAISNTATTKYEDFITNYSKQISQVSGLQASIDNLKERIENIANTSNLDETTAIHLMKQHYNLGNTILKAYQSGNLQIEYVKLSSMLDSLDDIGNSLEDLVTVSAKTRNANLSETLDVITKAEDLIQDHEIEMVYPSKILEISQEYYEKANYINNLKEENAIKTGLIISKNLHSNLLAGWAQEFADLYTQEYILNNPVKIIYSTTEIEEKNNNQENQEENNQNETNQNKPNETKNNHTNETNQNKPNETKNNHTNETNQNKPNGTENNHTNETNQNKPNGTENNHTNETNQNKPNGTENNHTNETNQNKPNETKNNYTNETNNNNTNNGLMTNTGNNQKKDNVATSETFPKTGRKTAMIVYLIILLAGVGSFIKYKSIKIK